VVFREDLVNYCGKLESAVEKEIKEVRGQRYGFKSLDNDLLVL